jgi:SH3-like domain-containing protein
MLKKMPILIIFFLIFCFSFKNLYSKDEYFLTLRNEKVNLRQGPSFDYPIKLFYKKRFLPILVQDSSDNFRKVRDHENNSGWIHISQLSKKKAAITIDDDLILFSNSTIYSNPLAIIKKGRLVKIIKCKNEWCKINTGEFKGWLQKKSLWGLI